MIIDLHTHSSASDGQYTPAELIRLAHEKNIVIFSLTDHDTVNGLKEAEKEAAKYGIRFIPGIEISAQEDEEIHILGYGINYCDKIILEACNNFISDRLNRGERICDFLRNKGIDITMDDIRTISGESNIGRPHFAKYLLNNGYVNNRKEAFDKYLDTTDFYEATRRKTPTIVQAIDLIHAVGGKAVLAHPALIHKTDSQLEEMIKTLKKQGLDGIECIYSQHSEDQTIYYLGLAERYNLVISCGSDFHGEQVKSHVELGMMLDNNKVIKRFIANFL